EVEGTKREVEQLVERRDVEAQLLASLGVIDTLVQQLHGERCLIGVVDEHGNIMTIGTDRHQMDVVGDVPVELARDAPSFERLLRGNGDGYPGAAGPPLRFR